MSVAMPVYIKRAPQSSDYSEMRLTGGAHSLHHRIPTLGRNRPKFESFRLYRMFIRQLNPCVRSLAPSYEM